ncbi:hypothetical protein FRC00_004437 [Tulasnella sp. 408]|nr:hypothetical protein FRC00_004437 [Tulasnella sp. 408]
MESPTGTTDVVKSAFNMLVGHANQEHSYVSETLVDKVMPECRRWKSFVLDPDYEANSFSREPRFNMLANANLDILTTFEVKARSNWSSPDPIRLPATPALREIRLEQFTLQWETFNALNAPLLRALRIDALPTPVPSFSQLLDILRSTPLLEILLLKGTTFEEETPNRQYPPVHLPHLRALYLSFPVGDPCDDLLRLIRTESLQQLLGRTVSFNLWEPPRFPILDNIKSLIPPTGAVDLYWNNNVHIATDPHPFYPIEWPYRDESLTTEGFAFTTTQPAKAEDFLDIAQWVSSLGAHTIVKLEIRNPHWRTKNFREVPVALLDHLPTLHTLVIYEGVKVDELFAQLGRPKRESSGRLHWPWPQLVNLDLGKADQIPAEFLIHLAQSRWGNPTILPSTSEPNVEPIKEERPPKLRSLAMPYTFTPGDRRQVETLALEGGPRPELPDEGSELPFHPSS